MNAAPLFGSWAVRGRSISLERPLVMGVLNATPDSFSDGGLYDAPERALARAERMVAEGADLLDLGGESTRPGAAPVSPADEAARILPVLRLLRSRLSVPVSVDTRRAEVARLALDEGAEIVNDVSALADPGMGGVVAEAEAGVVLMHMRGTPETMQRDPRYADVAGEVADELAAALERARAAGIADARVVLDPGIGFAKTAEHNLELLARLGELARLGRPLLLGPSRKSFIGKILGGVPAEERDAGTAAACVVGLLHGARVFRVHDVRVVRQALDVAEA
ncbi:MAG TPA: dihydropteroate synthase, partial [Longimicrobiaceae bacterium]|nr:dihydropteroate synthase [Longimicrobiaceae bacterium]